MKKQNQIIIYNTEDNKTSIALFSKDGQVWMNQKQLSELFETSTPNISMHVKNVLTDKELSRDSVVKDYLTTASDGKEYSVTFYSLPMIIERGFGGVENVRAEIKEQRRIKQDNTLTELVEV